MGQEGLHTLEDREVQSNQDFHKVLEFQRYPLLQYPQLILVIHYAQVDLAAQDYLVCH